jgi:uncharacterized protein YjiS (DUF1127 family)
MATTNCFQRDIGGIPGGPTLAPVHNLMEAVMNRVERLSYPYGEALAALLAAAWARVRNAFRAYVEIRSREAAIRELERLSDRTLRDIGLHRGGIREAVYRSEQPWS